LSLPQQRIRSAEGTDSKMMMRITNRCASHFATNISMVISLRNIPPEIEDAIRERSQRDGISLNKATVALLEAAIQRPSRKTDFEEFLGVWGQGEASEFDRALGEMRQTTAED
jgi:hypothetical protein